MTAASGVEQQSALVNSSKTVNAQIDLVIFEDGELIGADQRHYVAEIQARKAAADSLVQEVRAAPKPRRCYQCSLSSDLGTSAM